MSSASALDKIRVAAGTGIPTPHEIASPPVRRGPIRIDWLGSPGTFEPGVVIIRAEQDLKNVRVEATTLAGPRGERIQAATVRLHRVRLRGAKTKDGKVVVAPEFLLPLEGPFDLTQGESALIWLTVAIPEDAKPGKYIGRIHVKHGINERVAVTTMLSVLPFSPVKSRTVFSMLYTYEFRYLDRWEADFVPARKRRERATRAAFIARGKRVVRDMAEHGMNTVFPHCGPSYIERGGVPFLPDLNASLDAGREFGLTATPGWFVGWLVHAQWKDLDVFNEKKDVATLKKVAAAAVKLARARGFKSCILVPSDEPNHERKRPVAAKLLKGAGKIDGVRWAVTGEIEALLELSELYDIAIIAGGTPEDWAELKKRGKELWLYDNNSTTGRDPAWSRFVYGLLGWRADFDGVSSWTYPPHVEDFKGARTDARDGSKIPTFTKSGEPVTSVVWEAIREGIDDRRYIDTLEFEIARAMKGGRVADAKRASDFLDGLRERVDPNMKAHKWLHTEYGSPQPKGFDWKSMNRARARIISEIMLLRR